MANRNFKRKATASNKVVTVGDSYDVWPMGRVNLPWRVPGINDYKEAWFEIIENLVRDVVIGIPYLMAAGWLLDFNNNQMRAPMNRGATVTTKGYSEPICRAIYVWVGRFPNSLCKCQWVKLGKIITSSYVCI